MTQSQLPSGGRRRPRLRPRTVCLLTTAALALGSLVPAAAEADLAFGPGGATIGLSTTQAGGYPDITTSVAFQTDQNGNPTANMRNLSVDLPIGFAGDVPAVPTCPISELVTGQLLTGGGVCPAASQVGTAAVTSPNFGGSMITFPLFAVEPTAPYVSEFGFSDAGYVTLIGASVEPGDHHLKTTVLNAATVAPVAATAVTIWGVPADPSHDPLRGIDACQGDPTVPGNCFGGGVPAGIAPVPFLRNPTSCSGQPLDATLSVDSYEQPNTYIGQTSQLGPFTGCTQTSFLPSLSVQPTVTQADSPTGLTVDLKLPQTNDPTVTATSDLKDATVTLPQGFTISPSAATGLEACTDAQLDIGSNDPPACPLQSKIGNVTVTTPSLPDQLTGSIYVGQPLPEDRYRIFLTFSADNVMVKLTGSVHLDPSTGQLTTTFDDNPQLPFSDLHLEFFGGPRAALATPESCGTFATTGDLVPWSGIADVPFSDPMTIDSGCASGFSPSFTAGVTNVQAARFSPLELSFSRSDTDQDLSGLSVALPPGLVGKLAGVQQCSDQQLAAAAASTAAAELTDPSCPAGSQVGTVQTGSGPGSEPFFVGGNAYLTGPYKDAPYGLAVVVPAMAGPYDLGTVVVRQALYIDPTTAQVTAVSDPFPTILQGVPLRIRRVDVNLNRPNFTLNPTSCDPMVIMGSLSSVDGMSVPVSSRFQVGGCQGLGFSPKLAFKLTGNGQTHSGNHPTLTATLTDPAGEANIRSAKVALPLSLALDINNSKNVCDYDTAQAVHGGAVGCPASTIVGQATAVTPLLSQPLSGPVYLVQGIRFGKNGQRIHTLPSLLVPLRGQIAIDLRASSAVNGAQQLVTTFNTIPDAPVSKFSLTINGGRKGLLVITGRGKSICGASQVANSDFGAQSGKADNQNDTMATPCGRAAHARRHSKRHGRRR